MIESIALAKIGGDLGSLATSRVASEVQRTATAGAQRIGGDFGDVLAQLASTATANLKAGESAALAGIQGRASVQKVVESVMAAEQSLQAAIAVRDKVVSAYLEISRMAI